MSLIGLFSTQWKNQGLGNGLRCLKFCYAPVILLLKILIASYWLFELQMLL